MESIAPVFEAYAEQKIRVGIYNINYVTVGRGAHALLCCPGALSSIRSNFQPVLDHFDRSRFTIVAWDPPGHGKSLPPEIEPDPYFYEKYADTAHEFMKAIGIPQYSVVAWCAGGWGGMILAARRPHAVRKLVLIASNSYFQPSDAEMFKKLATIPEWTPSARARYESIYGTEGLQRYWRNWNDGVVRRLAVNNDSLCEEYLRDIRCPTLVMHGGKDPLISVDNAYHLAKHIENSILHIYPEGSHNVHYTEEDFKERVQDFLLDEITF